MKKIYIKDIVYLRHLDINNIYVDVYLYVNGHSFIERFIDKYKDNFEASKSAKTNLNKFVDVEVIEMMLDLKIREFEYFTCKKYYSDNLEENLKILKKYRSVIKRKTSIFDFI